MSFHRRRRTGFGNLRGSADVEKVGYGELRVASKRGGKRKCRRVAIKKGPRNQGRTKRRMGVRGEEKEKEGKISEDYSLREGSVKADYKVTQIARSHSEKTWGEEARRGAGGRRKGGGGAIIPT